MERFKGTVVWFSTGKRFGFISRQGAPDVFFHDKAIRSASLNGLDGEDVEFDLVAPGVLQADSVMPLRDR